MVAEHTLPRITKMTRKKGQVGRKYKGQTKNDVFRAAKAASDDAVASTGLNPTPMGRPPTQKAGVQLLSPPLVAARGTKEREEAMKRGEEPHLQPARYNKATGLLRRW